MKKNYNLISSILSMLFTLFLLVSLVRAWYVKNAQAEATGVTAVTDSDKIWDIELRRCKAVEGNNDTYTLGGDLSDPSVTIDPFDLVASYDKIIYQITFKTNLPQILLTMENTDLARSESFISKQTEGVETDDTSDDKYIHHNYLSNVAKFYLLNTNDHQNFELSNSAYKSFTYSGNLPVGTNKETISIITVDGLAEGSNAEYQQVYVYMLFDYNSDNINDLFNYNLGAAASAYGTSIFFKEDIRFVLNIIE